MAHWQLLTPRHNMACQSRNIKPPSDVREPDAKGKLNNNMCTRMYDSHKQINAPAASVAHAERMHLQIAALPPQT
eukprot:5678479-Amphidinium_carterae.1